MKLALFDLDHTLLPLDSDHTWGVFTTEFFPTYDFVPVRERIRARAHAGEWSAPLPQPGAQP